MDLFIDRREAGRVLAQALRALGGRSNLLVLGLPRGGVPVADEVARALHAPLDVFLVRKLGVPGQEELAMGAVASGGVCVYNESVVDALGLPPQVMQAAIAREQAELARREQLYRRGRAAAPIAGRTVVLVDDGLATGSTMRAAVRGVRALGPREIIVAVPVGAYESVEVLRREADAVVCPLVPESFMAVGLWYQDFRATEDREVQEILARAAAVPTSREEASPPA